MMRALSSLLLVGVLALLAGAAHTPVRAQDSDGPSYITPFPEGDLYKLAVIGDWYAEGLVTGIVEGFDREARLQIQRKHRPLHGLARPEFEDDFVQLAELIGRETLHIVVVMIGGNDRISVRSPTGGRRIQLGSEEWRTHYAQRVDRLMKELKRRNAAVYWAGLPPLRRPEADDDAKVINEIMRERAFANGLRYIDVHAGFLDEAGAYNTYGPDLAGKMRLLRSPDGYGFTEAGYRKLGHFIEREIKRDLVRARADRAIPLAGSEAEQRRINPARAAAVATAVAAAKGANKAGGATAAAAGPVQPGGVAGATPSIGAGSGGEQKADNGRIALRTTAASGREETVQVDILRPAISASVLALIARRDTGEKASQIGDTLIEPVAGGLLVLNSITPASERAGTGQRRTIPTQTPYFRVMVKGERIAPKPGRADDHAWPRPGAEPEAKPAATPAAAPPAAAAPARSPAVPAKAPPAARALPPAKG